MQKGTIFLVLFASLAVVGATNESPVCTDTAAPSVCVSACSPHAALKAEIAALRLKPTVCALPPYLAPDADFDAACRAAGDAGKKVLVSLGREECARCQRFYELVRTGGVKIDPARYVFVRLSVDDATQREYFLGTFEPADNRLPYVGVTDGARSEIVPCLTGAPAAVEYQKLLP